MTLKLNLRNDVWQVMGTVITPEGEKVRVRKSTGFTKHQKQYASAAMSRILHDAMNGSAVENDATSVDDAIRLYLTRPNPPGKTDAVVLSVFSRAMGKMPLNCLQVHEVMAHVNGRGNKAGTVARELNSINAMLAHARDMGLNAPDFRLKRPSVDDARSRWLTEDERDRLIAACSDEIRGLVTFLFYTGCTIGEAFSLNWQDARGGRAFFTRSKGKMRKRRTRAVPLTGEAQTAMGADTGGLVFTRPDGSEWERNAFYAFFHPSCMAAGITDFTAHDCRHTFASHLVQKGASLRAVADLLGHTSLAMVMRYSHLAPSHLSDTVNLLGCGGTKATHGTEIAI
jgi:integrase